MHLAVWNNHMGLQAVITVTQALLQLLSNMAKSLDVSRFLLSVQISVASLIKLRCGESCFWIQHDDMHSANLLHDGISTRPIYTCERLFSVSRQSVRVLISTCYMSPN